MTAHSPRAVPPPTDRRVITDELRELVERLPLPAVIIALDADATTLLVNDAFVRTFGYTLADIPTGEDWAVRAYPDAGYRRETFAAWNAAVALARAEQKRVEAMEFRVRCRDGTVLDVVFGAVVIGQFLLVTLIDVSERRQAEANLKKIRASLERTAFELTENIPVGTYTMIQPPDGGIGHFEFLSERFLEICGLDAEEARRDPFSAFACVHPDDHADWVRKNAEVFASKRPFRGECRVIANGELRWIMAESAPRALPDGSTVWEGVLIDITKQKQTEAALADARAAERSREDRQRRELESKLRTSLTASTAVHEIEQPLGRMLDETKAAIGQLRGSPSQRSHIEDYLEHMLAESRHVVDMLGRMKSLLRNVQSDHGWVMLPEVVASAILFSRPILLQHGILLREEGLDCSVEVHGDGVQIQTAVINLIRNAAEALAEGPADRRAIDITIVADVDRVVIVVGDAGPGMSVEQIAAAPFATSKPDGTGLGLYLVRTCMENHGGTMEVGQSSLGGAEVRLSFPCSGAKA